MTTGICAHRGCDAPPLFEVWGPVGFEDYLTVCPSHIGEYLDGGDTLHLIGHEQSVEEMVAAARR